MRTLRTLLPALLLVASVVDSVRAQDPFWNEFQSAIRLADLTKMTKLVKDNQYPAYDYFINRTERRLAGEEDPSLRSDADWLKRAWTQAFGNKLLDSYQELLESMDSGQRQQRNELVNRYRSECVNPWRQLLKSPLEKDCLELAAKMRPIAEGLEKLGDLWWASELYLIMGFLVDPSRAPNESKYENALEFHKKAYELRKSIGVTDAQTADAQREIKRLEDAIKERDTPGGAGGNKADGDGEAGPKFAEGSKWFKTDMTFQTVHKIESMKWPGPLSDNFVLHWLGMSCRGTVPSKSGKLPGFEGDPVFHRLDAVNFGIDMDGDDKLEVEFKQPAKPTIVEFERKVGSDMVPYAFLLACGGQQDSLQKVTVNYAPSGDQALIMYRSAASITGKIDNEDEKLSESITIYDENTTGVYGDSPLTLSVLGMRLGEGSTPLPLFDSMLIGKAKQPVPFSTYVVLDGKVYRLKIQDAKASAISMRRMDVATATVKAKVDGIKLPLESLVVEGEGDIKGALFDVASERRGVELPVGRYKILVGVFRTGKNYQTQKMVMLPGKHRGFEVKAGETFTLELGKPFHFEFEPKTEGDKIKVPGYTVRVHGVNGESYCRWVDEVPTPEVYVRKKGTKGKGGKPVEMKLCDHDSMVKLKDGQEPLFHPLDVEVDFPPRVDKPSDVEIHLFQKGHKWFGNIESEWKSPKS